MFGLFRKKDPVCGMKEEDGKGIVKDGTWFCSRNCADEYTKAKKSAARPDAHGHSCCH